MVIATSGRILIVDDEEIIRWTLTRKLSKEGYLCQEAGNAAEALKTMKHNPSELVILDINMPDKLGTELLPEIRANFPETGVIMASSVTDVDVIVRCIWDGAHDYICKPFKLDDVLVSVNMALEKRKLETQIRGYERLKTAREKTGDIRKLFLNAVRALISALEANDRNTAGHSQRVTNIALDISAEIGLSPDAVDDTRWAALLHDVGKIAVDRRILNKPGKLTAEEYRHIMTHAVIGPSIVKPLVNERVVASISHHHDHYDGTGLDQLVVRDNIPLGARSLGVADSFYARISDRPYREAMAKEEALKEIIRCSGTQFDPVIADAFIKMSLNKTKEISFTGV